MTARIFCGEGTECSDSCPSYDAYSSTPCRIVTAIIEVQRRKIKAIEQGKVVE